MLIEDITVGDYYYMYHPNESMGVNLRIVRKILEKNKDRKIYFIATYLSLTEIKELKLVKKIKDIPNVAYGRDAVVYTNK